MDNIEESIKSCLKISNHEKAEELLKCLSEMLPNDCKVKLARAQNLKSLNRPEETKVLCEEIINKTEIESLKSLAELELLLIYKKNGDQFYIKEESKKADENYNKAISYYDKIKNKDIPIKSGLTAMLAIGNIALAIRQYDKAEQVFMHIKNITKTLFEKLKSSSNYNLDLISFLSEAEEISNGGLKGVEEHFYNPTV